MTNWNPDSPFDIPGIVSPEDWDWREDGAEWAKVALDSPNGNAVINLPKYLGLLKELDRLDKLQHPPMCDCEGLGCPVCDARKLPKGFVHPGEGD